MLTLERSAELWHSRVVKPEELRQWMERYGVDVPTLNRYLFVFRTTVGKWMRGEREAPDMLALALEYLSLELTASVNPEARALLDQLLALRERQFPPTSGDP